VAAGGVGDLTFYKRRPCVRDKMIEKLGERREIAEGGGELKRKTKNFFMPKFFRARDPLRMKVSCH